jgi:DNA-binding transcriptional MerR regulator
VQQFSISQLAQFSGIKAHTIRVWEQRYNALNPQRSEGNTRYYDNSQLRRLLNIVSLVDEGNRVSELCTLSDEELSRRVQAFDSLKFPKGPEEYYISQLILAGINYDEWHFEKIFAHCLLRLGMKHTYLKILYPMTARMGLMWSHGTFSPAYEHFNSNLLRQKLFTAIDSLPPASPKAEGWLLFLPEDEFHELGLLFAQYMIKSSGQRAVYLGANLPMEGIANAVEQIQPDSLLLFLIHYDLPERTQQYLDDLASSYRVNNIYVSGNPSLLGRLKMKLPLQWLQQVQNLEHVLHQHV